jgi:A/G-specific adenine glycosylase
MHKDIAARVVRWQKASGRHDLPWQNTRDPYRVWLSEIMLQQTQVVTVRDYFSRFMERFPDVAALAAAPLDDVLALWSGLGYYSRARNLHRCATLVMDLHGGAFPNSAAVLQTLPGIGRSTAGAIAALCFAERVAILDGNVRRVLTRVLGFDADLSIAAHQRQLWDQATLLLPERDLYTAMPHYTQGLMDLGASVCSTRKPNCPDCPLAMQCVASKLGQPERFPVRTRKLKRSAQSLWLLWAQGSDGRVWLSKRPTPGVWAGLYCFPLFDSRDALDAALAGRGHGEAQDLPSFVHVLTHKDLHLHPVQVALSTDCGWEQGAWIAADAWAGLGLPAPVRKLLDRHGSAELPAPGAVSV